MDAYVQTGLGITVSVIIFLFGYWKTIGARKERIRAANLAVHRAFIRRMVLEDYRPQHKDISRLLEGKAREFSVSEVDLYSEEQVLNHLFTEVFENDLISPSQRVDIEQRLYNVFEEMARPREQLRSSAEEPAQMFKENVVMAMGVVASMLGAVMSLAYTITKQDVPELIFSDSKLLFEVIVVFVGSLAVIAAIWILKKSRETLEEPSRRSATQEGLELEQQIAATLEKLGVRYEIEASVSSGLQPDFLIELNGKKIAIDAKAWRKIPPLHFLARILNNAKALRESNVADEVLIVTISELPLSNNLVIPDGVHIISAKELGSFFQGKAE